MGEVLKEDKNSLGINNPPIEPRESRIRYVLTQLAKKQPKIVTISDCDKDGDIRFSVNLMDLGISIEDYYKYNKEFLSSFMMDFVGELLIRENLDLFVPKLTIMANSNYIIAVSKSIHRRFGMRLEKGVMTFSFHISLIQEILTEDFRTTIIRDQKNEQ